MRQPKSLKDWFRGVKPPTGLIGGLRCEEIHPKGNAG
jgi:hypothetical protein